MRGGAIPVLVWGVLLALLMALNWVWTGDAIEIAQFGFAVLVIVLGGLALITADRSSAKRGPPPRDVRGRARAEPDLSASSALAAVALSSIGFGFAFGHFLIYFGCGLLALSLARLALELRAERASRRRVDADMRARSLEQQRESGAP
jgi:hypothetical protein